MNPNSNLLQVNNLSKSYDGKKWALEDLSLKVQEGDFVILLGLSGSGKSTLLRCINRLIEPTRGQILFRNEDILQLKGIELKHYRRQIGMVFQQFNLVKNLTVLTNVLTGRLGYHSSLSPFSKEDYELAKQNLEKVGLQDFADKQVKFLSGGQQQRVAIARAIVNDPVFLLADEPTGNLDTRTSLEVMTIFQELHKNGKTILLVTHEHDIAMYAHRLITFRDGRIIADVPNSNPHDAAYDLANMPKLPGDEE